MRQLKHTLRNLVRRPVYSVVSIIGLSIAFASVIVIYLNVSYLMDYDSFHEKKGRIYRLNAKLVTKESENFHAKVGPALGPAMKAEIPEIEEMFRLVPLGKKLVTVEGKEVSLMENMHMADKSILDVFTLPIIHGSKSDALAEPSNVVVSESLAEKIFGKADVVGKTIYVDKGHTYTIAAVMEDMPPNSHHHLQLVSRLPDMYMNMEFMLNARGQESHWMPHCYTFILLNESTDIEAVHAKFPGFYDKNMVAFGKKIHTRFGLLSIPLHKLHFSRHLDFDQPKGIYTYVYILFIAGIFILIIAGINYANLFSSTLISRGKNLGVRKITGAKPRHVMKSLVGESSLIILVSFLIGLLLAAIVLHQFQHLFIYQGKLKVSHFVGMFIISIMVFFLLITVTGFPIIRQSKRNPMHLLLKNNFSFSGKINQGLNKPLLVIQLALSMVLIVSSLIISKQLSFLTNTDMGYNKNNVLMVQLDGPGITKENIKSFKNELLKNPMVAKAAFSSHIPGEELNSFHVPVIKEGNSVETIAFDMRVDADYFSLMNMEMINGKGFTDRVVQNEDQAIINEALLKKLGFNAEMLDTVVWNKRIIGVIKNVHFNSLHSGLKPIAYLQAANINKGYMNVKLATNNMKAAASFIRGTYNKVFPQLPYEQTFLDDEIKKMYENDRKHGIYLNVFSVLSIFIASIGLLGITMLMSKNQIKNIGIRKVVGARSGEIVAMLNKKFLRLVVIASIVGCPVAWYLMDRWLHNFAYQAAISWWMFVVAAMVVVIVTILTVSWQSWWIAKRNPVEALRYE